MLKKIFLIVVFSATLSGCFHLRNSQQIPAPLHTLYFKSESPYSPVSSELRELFAALNIKLVASPSQANYTLNLSKSAFNHSQSNIGGVEYTQNQNNITNTLQAVNYTYTQKIDVALTNNHTNKAILNKHFSASTTQTINMNQVTTVNTSSLATTNLPHDLVTQIYTWLTTNLVKNALKHPHKAG